MSSDSDADNEASSKPSSRSLFGDECVTLVRPRLAGALFALLGAGGAIALIMTTPRGDATSVTAESAGVSRIEQTFTQRLWASCAEDDCDSTTRATFFFTAPEGIPSVDVVVTMSFTHTTTGGDYGIASLVYAPEGGRYAPLAPGSYWFSSPLTGTSTTLTWIKPNLPAAGRRYRFGFGVDGRDGNGNGRFSVSARKMTVLVEAWTVGN